MAENVTLTVDGVAFSGWKSATVLRSIENIAGGFELTVTERWPGQQEAFAIPTGASCTVALGGDVVITGYVDETEPSYDADRHGVTVRGRDAAGDLVDCAAIHASGEWNDRLLDAIVRDIARPFGIPVRAETDLGKPFKKFAIQPGETAFEAIERACTHRAVLPVSDGAGAVVLTRAGAAGAATRLVFGENILAARGHNSDRDRHSEYIVIGQQPGNDFVYGEAAAAPEGRAIDPAVTRYRPLIVHADASVDFAAAADRAIWESVVRAGRARRALVTVQGWRDGDGALWRPNTRVSVADPWLAIDQKLLIATVAHTLSDDGGARTELTVTRPAAFELRALPEDADPKEPGW